MDFSSSGNYEDDVDLEAPLTMEELHLSRQWGLLDRLNGNLWNDSGSGTGNDNYLWENTSMLINGIGAGSVSETDGRRALQWYPASYRILGTIMQTTIFFIGFFGNVMICVVVRKTKSLHTPTYCYLVSLAVADILLVSITIPEAIISYHLASRQWIFGKAGCVISTFCSFLAINAGSISILAFTVERYIAICHPMLAQKVCTISRARKIIAATWLIVGIWSCQWFYTSTSKPLIEATEPPMEQCAYRLERSGYAAVFMVDFVLFYAIPLLISVVLYTRMGFVLYRSVRVMRMNAHHQPHRKAPLESGMTLSNCSNWSSNGSSNGKPASLAKRIFIRRQVRETESDSVESSSCLNTTINNSSVNESQGISIMGQQPDHLQNVMKSRCQVVKMLVIVVVCFAVLWLPYRALLVHNSIAAKPYLGLWYMLFAKTAVYINSAINPFLYTVLSHKFRAAFFRIICFWKYQKKRNQPRMSYSMTNMSLRGGGGGGSQVNGTMSMRFQQSRTLQSLFQATFKEHPSSGNPILNGRHQHRGSSLHSSLQSPTSQRDFNAEFIDQQSILP